MPLYLVRFASDGPLAFSSLLEEHPSFLVFKLVPRGCLCKTLRLSRRTRQAGACNHVCGVDRCDFRCYQYCVLAQVG